MQYLEKMLQTQKTQPNTETLQIMQTILEMLPGGAKTQQPRLVHACFSHIDNVCFLIADLPNAVIQTSVLIVFSLSAVFFYIWV